MGVFVVSFIFLAVAGKPEQTKGWIRDSGLYDAAAQSFKDQISKDNTIEGADPVLVQSAVDATITPEKVQSILETGIDSTYAWLDGASEQPSLNINEEEIKTEFADNLAAVVLARAQQLPACTYRNLPTTTDITTINCIPPGTDLNAQIAAFKAQILATDTQGLSDQTTGPATQTEDKAVNNIEPIRNYYNWIKLFPLISGVVFLLASALILLFSQPRIRALRTIGIALIPYAIIYLISGLLLPKGIESSFNALIQQNTEEASLATPLEKIAANVATLTGRYLITIGISLLVGGIALLIIYRFAKKPDTKPAEKPEQETQPNSAKQSK